MIPMEVHLHQCTQQENRQQELEKTLDILCLGLSSTFDTVFFSDLMEKLAARGLDEWTVSWVKNCLKTPIFSHLKAKIHDVWDSRELLEEGNAST